MSKRNQRKRWPLSKNQKLVAKLLAEQMAKEHDLNVSEEEIVSALFYESTGTLEDLVETARLLAK